MAIILDGTNGISTPDVEPTGSTVPTNGLYLPAANSVGIATNSTNAVYINSSQNVGIGTSSPASNSVTIANKTVAMTNGYGMSWNSGSAQYAGYDSNILQFITSSAERMRIDSSGNVGIGTSSPSYKLQVSPGTYSDQLAVFNEAGTWTANGGVVLADYYAGTTLIGGIKVSAASASSGYLSFHTGGTTERARIDSSGNLLINQTSNVTSSYLQIKGAQPAISCESTSTGSVSQVLFRNPNGQVGSIGTSGTSTSYNTSSDYRLKENIAPMTGALAKVAALNPVTYNWKVDGFAGQGFIAHELQAVVPDCVTGEKDAVDAEGKPEYQGVDTSFLVATLTAAIKEQQAIIEQQSQAIASITTRIAALEAK